MLASRAVALVVFTALLVLTACGGGSGTASTSSPSASPSMSAVSLTMTDDPPAGVAVLSFEVTVNSAVLQPGNVSLVGSPLKIEITKLETETAFLNTANVPAGTYSSISVTFSNPELTILNNSAAAIGTCGVGQVCELHPTLGTATVSFSGAPFPLTLSAGSPTGLLVDFNLTQSIQPSLDINPVITITQLPAPQGAGALKELDEVKGQVTGVDTANSQFTLKVSDSQTLTIKVDSTTVFEDFSEQGLANAFSGVASGQILEVELSLMPGGAMVAKKVELEENERDAHEGALEGTIVSVDSATQFKMVVKEEVPDVLNVSVGDPVTVTIQDGATFAVDRGDLTLPSGLSFASSADLLTGQAVQIHPVSTSSGAVTTDRVRLRLSRVRGRVASLSTPNFLMDSLPDLFTTATPPITELDVRTFTQTAFEETANVSGLNVGDNVSVAGLLFKSSGDPVLLAKKIRKR